MFMYDKAQKRGSYTAILGSFDRFWRKYFTAVHIKLKFTRGFIFAAGPVLEFFL